MHLTSAILAACGGFLLAVLWMDLLFDVQVLRHPARGAELPEPVLASIAAYYHRVTTSSRPMSHAIGAVMAVTVITSVIQIAANGVPGWFAVVSLSLCGAPIALAVARVYPNAVRLGSRVATPAQQSELARSICRDHLFCFASILAFVALQLLKSSGNYS